MKKAVKITASVLVMVFALLSSAIGQDELKIKRLKKLTFNYETDLTEITVESTSDYNYFVFNIHCELTEGQVTIDIIDPKGNKQGSFTVKTDDGTITGRNTSTEDSVRGTLTKIVPYPMKGEWKIKVNPSSAVGDLAAFITLGFEPRIDTINLRTLKN